MYLEVARLFGEPLGSRGYFTDPVVGLTGQYIDTPARILTPGPAIDPTLSFHGTTPEGGISTEPPGSPFGDIFYTPTTIEMPTTITSDGGSSLYVILAILAVVGVAIYFMVK